VTKSVGQLVDEQVRRWQLERRLREREQREGGRRPQVADKPASLVAISVSFGSEGIEVGRRVGELLQFPVYEREILEHISRSQRVRMETLETLDEHARGRLNDYLEALFREHDFDQSDYMRALTDTVASLWGHGPCVMIGHGCSHLVPRPHSLRVRFVAPLAFRIKHIQALEGLDEEAARHRVAQIDAEREAFVRHSFRVNIADPLAYDMLINSASLPVEVAAATVVEAFRRRFPPT
jgi:cytidylate kinase